MASGPCTPWATAEDTGLCSGADALDARLLTDMLDVASELLYVLSGRQFSGVCTDVVRPCRMGSCWWPDDIPWRWLPGWGTCGCGAQSSRTCGCVRVPEITLGAVPLRDITEVRIDGAVLDPSAYRIDDHRWLVRVDGDAWPMCQDLLADPLTDADTFQVSFEWGKAPPRAGVLACTVLARELALAQMQSGKCALPRRVQTIVRQGVTVGGILDPLDMVDKGRTGLYEVDLFLGTYNPHRLQRSASVISPDIPRPVRRTATTPGS